jgi:molybdate/tungstate transport system substrate-binding protein
LFVALAMATGLDSSGAQSAAALNVCHAGSLQSALTAVEQEFARQHPGVLVNDVSGGSLALAARIAAGLQSCDVYAAADYLDIDLFLKPAGFADYTLVFAKGRMVLAYLNSDPLAAGVSAHGEFKPPDSIPDAAKEWYRVLLKPGVRIAGSHPFLDPAGYRSHMIFELTESYYGVPNLFHELLEHYTILPGAGPGRTLGDGFDFQFTYEHTAAAAARTNPAYRYVILPDRVDLSTPANAAWYSRATVTVPGIGTSQVSIPAARVAWGFTIPRGASLDNAIAFVKLLLGSAGAAALRMYGPDPVTPVFVSSRDYPHVPAALQPLVKAGAAAP